MGSLTRRSHWNDVKSCVAHVVASACTTARAAAERPTYHSDHHAGRGAFSDARAIATSSSAEESTSDTARHGVATFPVMHRLTAARPIARLQRNGEISNAASLHSPLARASPPRAMSKAVSCNGNSFPAATSWRAPTSRERMADSSCAVTWLVPGARRMSVSASALGRRRPRTVACATTGVSTADMSGNDPRLCRSARRHLAAGCAVRVR
jgi:hypothetical protein